MNPWSGGIAGIEACYGILPSDMEASEVYLQIAAICKGPRERAERRMRGRNVYLVVALTLASQVVYSTYSILDPPSRVVFEAWMLDSRRACCISGVVDVASKFRDLDDLRGSQRPSVSAPGCPAERRESAVA